MSAVGRTFLELNINARSEVIERGGVIYGRGWNIRAIRAIVFLRAPGPVLWEVRGEHRKAPLRPEGVTGEIASNARIRSGRGARGTASSEKTTAHVKCIQAPKWPLLQGFMSLL